jgi:hypothetical protein
MSANADEYSITTVRMTKAQRLGIEDLARRNQRSVSGEIRVAIRDYLTAAGDTQDEAVAHRS